MRPLPPRSTLFPYTTLFRSAARGGDLRAVAGRVHLRPRRVRGAAGGRQRMDGAVRSEEHTSELQSHSDLVCRLLLEKKKKAGVQTGAAGIVFLQWLQGYIEA